ncbi:nucleolar protein 58-like [Arachis ipaensis]|uniref:nucleolar protein 58-like n=1 Tax=Arachis ipaensis TaxID=130454 RepID=UPI000A2B542F|nr:nucleolar protein 58-like [Arachis ipaensis]
MNRTGWEDVSNTWETSESLEHVRDYVNEFDDSIKSRIIENLKKRNKEKASSSRPFTANRSSRFSKEEEESKEKEDKKEEKEEKQEETKDDKDDSDYHVNVKVSPGVNGGVQIKTNPN